MGQDVLVLRNEFRNLCANPTLRDHGSKRTARLEGCEEVSIPLKRAMVPRAVREGLRLNFHSYFRFQV